MTLSRRSFLGRGLAALGGAVAAAKLGSTTRRAEAVSTTADLAALQQAERDAHPLYLIEIAPDASPADINPLWESAFGPYTLLPYPAALSYRVLGPVPQMREWYRPTTPRPSLSDIAAGYGARTRLPFERTMLEATLSEPSPRRHTRLLFAESRHVKRRG